MDEKIKERLEYLRGEIKAERISYGEIAELQSLKEFIDPGDVELLEWAGVEEFPEKKFYKWVVELQVEASWVADGFDLTDERAHKMLANELPYAYSEELKASVVLSPDPEEIRKEQGYNG